MFSGTKKKKKYIGTQNVVDTDTYNNVGKVSISG